MIEALLLLLVYLGGFCAVLLVAYGLVRMVEKQMEEY